ncbi:MAG: hypothetical protein IJ656_01650 [Bacilli bacterium]|nr:hypothetical protein [Bacilli bacterium]
MSNLEILALIITGVCLLSFSAVFTVLFRSYNLTAIKDVKEGREDLEIINSVFIKEKENQKPRTKGMKIAGRVVYYSLYAIVILIFAFSLYSRINSNAMIFGDKGLLVIGSDSMSEVNKENTDIKEAGVTNQFDTYDILGLTKYKSISEVKLYDVVAYKAKDGRTIVHRIISLDHTEDGDIKVITRGDKYTTKDSEAATALYSGDYLTYKDLIGYYDGFRMKALGSFVIFLQSNSGIITVVSVAYCVFMFDHYKNKLDKTIDDRTNQIIKLLDYDLNNPVVESFDSHSLIYKGIKFDFNKGNFIKKEDLNDESIKEYFDKTTLTKIEDGETFKKIEALEEVKGEEENKENSLEDKKDIASKEKSSKPKKKFFVEEEDEEESFLEAIKKFRKNKSNDHETNAENKEEK